MKRGIIFIIWILFCIEVFLWSCAHGPSLIFKDPKSEKKVEYLQEKLKIRANDTETRIALGKLFLSEIMINQAINEFEKVLSIDSDYIEAYLLLSLALQQGKNPDLKKAMELLEKASKIEPNNADAHLNLGQIYNKLREGEKAKEEFSKVIELSNEPSVLLSAHLGLMAIYKKRGELQKAQEEYEAAYKIFPGVEEMIKQAEINRITPTPKYLGDNGFHPYPEERIKKIREKMMNPGEEK
jgi:tetratricopeptide (TPR) repeat protein